MKWIQITGHPLTLMIIFPCLLIGSDKFVVPYALYLWGSLPAGSPYAIMALAGLVLLFTGYRVNQHQVPIIKIVLSFAGLLLLLLSLVDFFSYGDKSATFELAMPLLSFILFFISVMCFMIHTVFLIIQLTHKRIQQG